MSVQYGAELWRGGVTPWQCDEMGHMNVRLYLAAANEGLTNLAAMLGMPHAYTPSASSTPATPAVPLSKRPAPSSLLD